MIRALLAAALILTAALPAQASEKKKEGEGVVSRDVDLVPVAAPIVVNGVVRNYVFVTVRVTVTAAGDPDKVRQAEPLLRNAIVGVVNGTSMGRQDNYNLVDARRLIAALSVQFPAILGKGQVRSITIPKQQPKNVLQMPKRPA